MRKKAAPHNNRIHFVLFVCVLCTMWCFVWFLHEMVLLLHENLNYCTKRIWYLCKLQNKNFSMVCCTTLWWDGAGKGRGWKTAAIIYCWQQQQHVRGGRTAQLSDISSGATCVADLDSRALALTKEASGNSRAVCTSDVLQSQTENFEQPKNDSIASESSETSRVFRSIHLHYTAILVFFQGSFARNLKNIPPIIWYCCNIWRPYKISNILYKTNEKAVPFLSTTSGTSCDLSRVHSFSRPHGVSLFGNIETCVVVSFSGVTLVQWSDVEQALCAFSGVCWDYFQVFRQFGCAKWKYCEKWHLPTPKIWNPFFLYTTIFNVSSALFSTPFVLFSCTPFGTK